MPCTCCIDAREELMSNHLANKTPDSNLPVRLIFRLAMVHRAAEIAVSASKSDLENR